MKFKDKVLKVRGKIFTSQELLVKQLGISFATFYRRESDHYEPSTIAKAKSYKFCKDNNIVFGGENKYV